MKRKQAVWLLLSLSFSLTLALLVFSWLRSQWLEVDWPKGSKVEQRAVQEALTLIVRDPSAIGEVQVIHMSTDDNSIILALPVGSSLDLRGWKQVSESGGVPCFIRTRPNQDVTLVTIKLPSRRIVGLRRYTVSSKESCKSLAAKVGRLKMP